MGCQQSDDRTVEDVDATPHRQAELNASTAEIIAEQAKQGVHAIFLQEASVRLPQEYQRRESTNESGIAYRRSSLMCMYIYAWIRTYYVFCVFY